MFLIAGPAAFVVQWSAMPCHEIRIHPVLCFLLELKNNFGILTCNLELRR